MKNIHSQWKIYKHHAKDQLEIYAIGYEEEN